MKKYLQLLRVKNYVKNALIFLPFIFSGSFLTIGDNYVKMVIGVLIFCMTSSLIYIFNDYIDRDKDKLHPKKRHRPLACGTVTPRTAIVFMVILFVGAALLTAILGQINVGKWLILYLICNVLYTIWLKNIPVLDITVLAVFFIIRIYYGASLINVPVSDYLLLTVMSVAFLMGANKRQKEKLQSDDYRGSLKYYSNDFLSKISQMFLVLSIVFYSLWILSDTNMLLNKSIMLISIIIIIFILLNYQYLVDNNDDGNPVNIFLSSPVLLLSTLGYCVVIFLGFLL
ncbi:MAG: UbiA prenyltransferase family protein [Saccharofermentans sp.]|nr:UbiA prenyltransferase family protein [Saccharofermentans sp.]